ncbi:MAG: hypothetical protein OHK0012_19400 [Synechococcales cyanobacterium]
MNVRAAMLVLGLAVAGWYGWNHTRPLDPGPGVVAPRDPVQRDPQDRTPIRFKDDYIINRLADFEMTARVLATKHYTFGRESQLSPVDVAFGWGPMSDAGVLAKLTITQSNRWYYWRAQELPIPRAEIEHNSANMHLVPANAEVDRQLQALRVGQVVTIEGSLIRVEARDGWRWQSSLTRTDTGNGACELIWVDRLVVKSPT